MADPEHVKRFCDPSSNWNSWRNDHPDIVPDLSDAELSPDASFFGMDLRNAILHRINLSSHSVIRCDFQSARAHGLIANNTSFIDCNFNQCEVSKPAVILDDASRFKIDAYGVHSRQLVEVSPTDRADFRDSTFDKCSFEYAVLDHADFWGARFYSSRLSHASLRGARFHPYALHDSPLNGCDFFEGDLGGADLRGANFSCATFRRAVLTDARFGPMPSVTKRNVTSSPERASIESYEHLEAATDLRGADLREADLRRASFVQADLREADLRGAQVYGVSAWNVKLDGTKQSDLIVTPPSQPTITVDDLEVAQFIYLMLDNANLRRVIDTVTSKVALVLGNFSPARKPILEKLRNSLRAKGYVPVLFDFVKPRTRSLSETIGLLARMAKFVIADVSDPRCVPAELEGLVRDCPSLPIQPIVAVGQVPYALLGDFASYPWCLPLCQYSADEVESSEFQECVIQAVEKKLHDVHQVQ